MHDAVKAHAERIGEAMVCAMETGELVTVLTGAGVSAESGIPTFRGSEGYWTVGSRNYQPSDIATQSMFREDPREVWKWFLFRRGVCMDAVPNPGHLAITRMEAAFRDRFRLITQNVDGLHLRAGSTAERTYQVHGNLNYMRCARECSPSAWPIPKAMPRKARGDGLSEAEWQMLTCPTCGAIARPHVLLWDEYYDEQHYRFQSSLGVASNTCLLIVVGTTGGTNLPHHVAAGVLRRGGTIIDVNIQSNVFSDAAQRSAGGGFLQGSSGDILPELADIVDSSVARQSTLTREMRSTKDA